MTAILTESLTKKYGKTTAVNSLCLNVEKGELFALLGVNGAGKSTLIKLLSCLTRPTSGDAFVMGKSVVSEPLGVKAQINISPQETAVARSLGVRENLELIARIYGSGKKQAEEKAQKTMQSFGMSNIAQARVKTLSGGWKRRLSIAMALISDPSVLFLDEPTLGLDVLARRELWNVIKGLKGKVTIILTTHYLEEAEALADRVGIMAKGDLRAIGTADELKRLARKESFEDAFIELAGEGELLK